MKTALILAGSGARGIIQAGMIDAFVSRGFSYDTLYGSSAGALNGAMLHAGQLKELKNMWATVRNKDVFSNAPWNMLIKNKGSMYDSTPLRKLIEKTVSIEKLRANPKRFWINISNLSEWRATRVLPASEGVVDFLWTSACPPILFPPNKHPLTGQWITDGGIMNNYSISDAINDGHDRLIIFAPMIPEPKPIKNIIDAIDITVSTMLYNQLTKELKFVEKLNTVPGFRKIETILVTLEKPSGVGIFDFDQTPEKKAELWHLGYKLAAEKLQNVAKVVA